MGQNTIFFVLWACARFKLRATKPISICSANEKFYSRIKLLKLERSTRFFGRSKHEFDEMSVHRNYNTHRVLVNKHSQTVAYAEFMNFPLIQALPCDCYMDWLHYHFCIPLPLSMANILFFNHFTFSNLHMPQILYVVLKEIFLREHKLSYILTVEMPREGKFGIESPELPHYFVLEQYSTVYYPRIYNLISCSNTQRIHVISRGDILNNISYRKALPEDNDDIVEIISAERPDLVRDFGEFFICEELLREDKDVIHDKIIVAEIDHTTMGFLWLTDNIDILKLIRNFEVGVYNFLIKFDAEKKYYVITQKLKQLAHKRHSDVFDEEEIANIFREEKSAYHPQINKVNSDHRFCNVFTKLEKLHKALTSVSYYQKPYKETLKICVNIPEDCTIYDERVLDHILQENSNVFGFHLMGIKHEFDNRQLYRFLLAAFSLHKDRDYCIISLPAGGYWIESLSVLLTHFIRVVPRPAAGLLNQIYITHRSAVLGDISVHMFTEADVPFIEDLISLDLPQLKISGHDNEKERITYNRIEQVEEIVIKYLMNDILTNDSTKYKMLTIRCGDASRPVKDNHIIGFVIMRPFHDLCALQNHFQLSEMEIDELYCCGEILILKLSRIYDVHSYRIFRDIACISGYWRLIYLQPAKCLPNDLSERMQPLEPKTIKKIMVLSKSPPRPFNDGDFLRYLEPIDYIRDKFAVYTHNLRESRVFSNKGRIVILGFTEITKAFLRMMIFNWNSLDCRYSQTFCCIPILRIFVIANPGEIESSFQGRYPCKSCTDFNECWVNFEYSSAYIRDTITRIDLRKYIFFISGKVDSIDRTNCHVILDNGCKYHYDSLLLFCYSFFAYPKPFHALDETPINYTHINTRNDRFKMYQTLNVILEEEKAKNDNFRFLIYGSRLHAFSFIDFLITHGVKPKWITLAVPHRNIEAEIVQELNHPSVDYPIEISCEVMIEDLGVTVHRNYNFLDWSCDDSPNIISQATFVIFPRREKVTISCDYFVSFHPRPMTPQYVQILDEADISLDEEEYICVDANHRTNDWKILAAGNHIAIQNYTISPNYQYRYTNFKEQAEKIIRSLDVALIYKDANRRYFQPSYFQVNLPLEHFLVKVTVPKRYLAGQLPNHMCNVLTTFHEGTFCRVRLTEFGIIEEITVIGKVRYMSLDFLQFFCGKHESLLNNLNAHWCCGDIKCILKFLLEPWSELLMHDHFPKLLAENKDIMDKAFVEFSTKPLSQKEIKRDIKRTGKDKHIQQELELRLLSFLRKHRVDFDHPFALPEDFEKKTT